MRTNGHVYGLVLYRTDGSLLGYADLELDWEPALQWVRFTAVRRGMPMPRAGEVWVEPVRAVANLPFLSAVRIIARSAGARRRTELELPLTYFTDLAREAATSLVADGTLRTGETFRYRVIVRVARENAGAAAPRFDIEDTTSLPPIGVAALGPLLRGSTTIGPDLDEDVPAFIASGTLDEIDGLTRRAGAEETGGALIGRLCRDPTVPEVFARVTGQLPARCTEATATRLRFTSETWIALREDLAARGSDEVMLGWWHSHPVREWCRRDGCARDVHDRCSAVSDCFSEDDRAVHRAVFPGAYSLALVANDVGLDRVKFSAFGWRCGGIAQRGLHVLPSARGSSAAAPASPCDPSQPGG